MIHIDALLVVALFLALYLFERWQTRREDERRYAASDHAMHEIAERRRVDQWGHARRRGDAA